MPYAEKTTKMAKMGCKGDGKVENISKSAGGKVVFNVNCFAKEYSYLDTTRAVVFIHPGSLYSR